ncbi:MAG: MFS transporter [Candidatus Thorarchaeota archaeon]
MDSKQRSTTAIPHREQTVEPTGLREAISEVFSQRSYTVFLGTAWVFYTFEVLYIFYNLYLRSLGWGFLLIGLVGGANMVIAAASRIAGGYLGDITDRRHLAVAAMLFGAVTLIITGLFTQPFLLVLALLIYATMNLVKSGSSAYVMDKVPRRQSGLALSIFSAGRVLGVVTLIMLNVLVVIEGFGQGFRTLALVGGTALLVSAITRAALLDSSRPRGETRSVALWHDFLSKNWRALRLLVKMLPGAVVIVVLDSVSDGLFKFGALLYTNEFLGVSISGIGTIMTAYLLISVPLLLKVGRLADTSGLRRTAMRVYGIMPLSMLLILLAPMFPFWAPAGVVTTANNIMPGLGALFTTVFVAIVLKYVNDGLWWLLLFTMIRKNLPRRDTAKFLALFWALVSGLGALGPVIGGAIFALGSPALVFVIGLAINIAILAGIHWNGFTGVQGTNS